MIFSLLIDDYKKKINLKTYTKIVQITLYCRIFADICFIIYIILYLNSNNYNSTNIIYIYIYIAMTIT
jgi:hypothetical protein